MPEVFRNRSFLILFFTVLIFFVAQGTAGALNLHGSKFFWNLPVDAIQFLSIVAALGLLVGIPIVALLGPHVEKRTMTLWSLAYIVVAQAGMPLLRIAGVLPPNGPLLTTLLAVNNVLVYGAVTVLAISFQSMMADAADEHELLFGARREGLYFSGTTFSAKAASGIGSFLAGVALDLIAFPVDIAAKGGDAIHLTRATVNDLGIVYGVFAGGDDGDLHRGQLVLPHRPPRPCPHPVRTRDAPRRARRRQAAHPGGPAMRIDNRITRMLGVEYPVVQAPMGWIARAQLASAVCMGRRQWASSRPRRASSTPSRARSRRCARSPTSRSASTSRSPSCAIRASSTSSSTRASNSSRPRPATRRRSWRR
ncbi:MAG: MFS transporter [Rhizomicrobium sp.]